MIYEPAGRAKEYAELACNLYTGCVHGCRYCYVPTSPYRSLEAFERPKVRDDALVHLTRACRRLKGDPRWVLMSFTCDPYPPDDDLIDVTREALLIMERYQMKVSILTKGGSRAIRDFDIIFRNRWRFGTSINMSPKQAEIYEPKAAPVGDRIRTMQIARARWKINTWISIEPVIFPKSALALIRYLKLFGGADYFKVGKLNHVGHTRLSDKLKEQCRQIDWRAFLAEVRQELQGRPHYIKRDLLEAAGEIQP